MVKIQFETDSDAFIDFDNEVVRILHEIADKIKFGSQEKGGIYDANGEKIGTWKVDSSVQVQA